MQGKWKGCNNIVNIINVYSLCSLSEKVFLWEKILQLKRSIGDGLWCVLGDFIAITRKEKRLMRSNESQHGAKEIEEFNVFVDTWSWLICH